MPISLASLQTSAAKPHPLCVVYGVEGVGKTSYAAEWPNPVLMLTPGENTPKGVEVPHWRIESFGDFMDGVGALFSDEHDRKTLVLDALDGLERIVHAETCSRNRWSNIEDAGFGKGYVAAGIVWGEIMEALAAIVEEKAMNVILIGHSEVVRFDSPTCDPFSRYTIKLHKGALGIVQSAADVVVFLNYRTSLKEVDVGFKKTVTHAEGAGLRVAYLEERPGFIAKNRYDMPSEMAFKKGQGFSSLAKYLPHAAD